MSEKAPYEYPPADELERQLRRERIEHAEWVAAHQRDTDAAWRRVARAERKVAELRKALGRARDDLLDITSLVDCRMDELARDAMRDAIERLHAALKPHAQGDGIERCSQCGKPLLEWVHRCEPMACENCGATEQPDKCSGGSRCKFPPHARGDV